LSPNVMQLLSHLFFLKGCEHPSLSGHIICASAI
jgi:hypothetical protein